MVYHRGIRGNYPGDVMPGGGRVYGRTRGNRQSGDKGMGICRGWLLLCSSRWTDDGVAERGEVRRYLYPCRRRSVQFLPPLNAASQLLEVITRKLLRSHVGRG